VPPDGQGVRVGEQRAGLAGGGLAGVEDGHPGLGGVGRVRDQPVEGGVVEPNGLGVVLARRVPGQLLECDPADRNVQRGN
jgi:hypothetical protein